MAYLHCKSLLPLWNLLLTLLMRSFNVPKYSSFLIFSLTVSTFCTLFKNFAHEDIQLNFLLDSLLFCLLHVDRHFSWSWFMCMVRGRSQYLCFFQKDIQLIKNHILKRLHFPFCYAESPLR